MDSLDLFFRCVSMILIFFVRFPWPRVHFEVCRFTLRFVGSL